MTRTAVHEPMTAAGAHIAEYSGLETARDFGDPRAEYFELRHGCALYDLGWRAKILITGNDRVRWLNGMLTNNVKDLPRNTGNYNFLLNPQGRILADMYVYNRGDYFLVDTERWQAPRILEVFDHYIIMDEVEVSDASDKLTALAVQGAKARDVLSTLGCQLSDAEPLVVTDTTWDNLGISVTRMIGDVAATYELWLAAEHAPKLWDALRSAGARPVGMQALEWFRIASGIPRYGVDIRDRDLPQETEQNHALHFRKGCYVGQEIVERIHSRGQVHRKFTGFVVEGPLPEPGTKVVADDKEVGEITSAAAVPTRNGDRPLALGYIRREVGTPGAEVQIGAAKARVSTLPFKIDE